MSKRDPLVLAPIASNGATRDRKMGHSNETGYLKRAASPFGPRGIGDPSTKLSPRRRNYVKV